MSTLVRVGVRQLRQSLSVYLRRVAAGESFEVTERGTPVALLGPLPGHADPAVRLVAQGRAIPADGSLEELGPALRIRLSTPLSEVLGDLREESS